MSGVQTHEKRAIKIYVITGWVTAILGIIGTYYARRDLTPVILLMVVVSAFLSIPTIMLMTGKVKSWLSYYLTLSFTLLTIIIYGYILKDNPEAYILNFFNVVLPILFFKPKLVLTTALITMGSYIIMLQFNPMLLPVDNFERIMAMRFLTLSFVTICCYGVTKICSDLLEDLQKRNMETEKNNKLNLQVLEKIKEASAILLREGKLVEELALQTKADVNSINSSSKELAMGAEESQRYVKSFLDTINQFSKQSQDSKEKVLQAQNILAQINQVALTGEELAKQATGEMEVVKGAVQDGVKAINVLKQSSEEINSLVEVIKSIAEQTNLLSLNASIEAARAGEHGRGFSVVAEEVYKLAVQSKEASGRITEILSAINKQVEIALQTLKRGSDEVELGAIMVNQLGGSLLEITPEIQKSKGSIQEVIDVMELQGQENMKLAAGFEHLSVISHQTASGCEQMSLRAGKTTELADQVESISSNLLKISKDIEEVFQK